jgi:hypothetical protein
MITLPSLATLAKPCELATFQFWKLHQHFSGVQEASKKCSRNEAIVAVNRCREVPLAEAKSESDHPSKALQSVPTNFALDT